MAINSRALKKFKVWTDLLDEQGWGREDKNFLIDYWWKHHDDNGDLYPPGQHRPDDIRSDAK